LPRRATVLLLMLLGAVAGCGPAGAAEERGVEIRLRSLTLSQRAAQLVVAGAVSTGEARRRVVMEGLGGVSAESREGGDALLHDSLFTGAQVPPLVARELPPDAEALDPGRAVTPGAAQIALGVLRAPTLNGGLPSPLLLLPEVRDGEAVGARVRAARALGIIPAVEAFGTAPGVEGGAAQRWDRARLEAIEIRALRRALAEGAGVVLLAPTVLPALTGDTLPLPLSAAAISGVLRGELGWEGTVAAELPPLTARGDVGDAGEAAVAAIGAGIDLLLDVADPDGVVDALVRAVAVGRLPEWRLDEAAGRVLQMKAAAVGSGAAAGTATPAPPGGDVPVAAAVSRAPVLRPARAEDVGMDEALLARVDATIRAAIAEGAFPGAALAVGRRGRLVRLRGYGNLDRAPGAAAVEPASSLYDVASLTKVVATTSAVMALVEEGRLALDAPAARYLGEFTGGGRDSVTVRQLLAHTAGLPAGLNLYGSAASPEDAMRRAASVRLVLNPGEAALYSDLGMILLAEVVGRAAGEPLDRFLARRVFAPLGMSSTMFLPPLVLQPNTATSALDSERDFPLRGVVHDRLTSRTPCVFRPITRIPSTDWRFTIPFLVITISSSPGRSPA
jgi:CubicO group peptidase (beta-lactamase class C family)